MRTGGLISGARFWKRTADRHRLRISWAVIAGLIQFGALPNAGAETNRVIGLLLPPEEPQSANIRDGVLCAVEQANSNRTGITRVVIRGRQGQWGADAVEAARMVTDDGAGGLIAPPNGAATHLVLQVAGRTAVPVVSLCPDASVSQTGIPWMVRVAPSTGEEARALFSGMRPQLSEPARTWLALVPDGRAGREIADDLRRAAAPSRCHLDQVVNVSSALSNAGPVVQKVIEQRPEAVLVWLEPAAAGKFARQLKEARFDGILAGPSWLRCEAFAAAAGSALEGFVVPRPVLDKASQECLTRFEAQFQIQFGHRPNAINALSFDAARILIELLDRAESSPPQRMLPRELLLPGASGTLCFDAEGNRKLALELVCGRNGRFVPMRRNPNKSEANPNNSAATTQ